MQCWAVSFNEVVFSVSGKVPDERVESAVSLLMLVVSVGASTHSVSWSLAAKPETNDNKNITKTNNRI